MSNGCSAVDGFCYRMCEADSPSNQLGHCYVLVPGVASGWSRMSAARLADITDDNEILVLGWDAI